MKHEYIQMGEFVFKSGNPSNGKFYVILSGEVGVIVQTQVKTIFDKDKEKIGEKTRSQFNSPLINIPEDDSPTRLLNSPTLTPTVAQNSPTFLKSQSSAFVMAEKTKTVKILNDTAHTASSNTTSPSFGGLLAAKKASRKFGEKTGKKKSANAGGSEGADDKYAEYRQMVRRHGVLVRVICKGESFGETGNI